MTRTITIDGVTRIEGHAKITIQLNDAGKVSDARFHVTQFRGFEKFVEGRPMTEMPGIMARICGICPVSHLLASAKACDDMLAVDIPPTAEKLRRIMNLAQLVQSHALSFFHLSSPDLLFGMDGDPKRRNIFGLIQDHPEFARDGILLRKFGQEIIAHLGGKKIHPAWAVPGGVNAPLTGEKRDLILKEIPAALDRAQRALEYFHTVRDHYPAEVDAFGNFPTLFAGLSGPDGLLEHYDGTLRFVDEHASSIAELTDKRRYGSLIEEAVENYSFLKFPYFKPRGYPEGIYRVGPLARLIVAERCGTVRADQELGLFRTRLGRAPQSSFHFHWARLIEIIYGIEMIQRLLESPDILDTHVRARARPNRLEGVGISEAPRGTLIHHYKIDDNGLIRWANLIIATGHNNLAMNRGVRQVAERFVDGNKLREGMLNRVEAVIRCFDPCLSCSTHALGQMPLYIELIDTTGKLCDVLQRNGHC
ncbi:MAG: Ni/Fe hydrogenase subunit alpha [Planctomycetia bacterium]|nr:Ni/Fe hydrogenase subunit alpha [Planctomycetia bacterium]